MPREFQLPTTGSDWNEPLWPYDMDDSYLQLDLGEGSTDLPVDVRIFKKPWFKQNYRHGAPRNVKFYRRPLFEIEVPE